MSSQPPPDLRVLCRKLSSIPPAQLPHALPALSKHVARCRHALSGPQQQQQQQQQKARDDASQTSLLVHKLKTGISTLLTGRSPEARFAAIGLVKAAVDVGGWETLRGSEPWVRGLLSVVQKGDAAASKELAVVALTRIYVSVQPYQTLVREIATPTVPAFATACLQLIKPAGADRPPVAAAAAAPLALVETICDAFSTLIPLYPTTFRPFASQVRSAVRGYLAPTSCDAVVVPRSLQRAAGRLAASLHHVAAAKSGGDEWAKMVDGVIRELHATADQVLRAIDETWDSTGGYGRTAVDPGGEPSGGSASADKLPPWDGVGAGAERLTGLFRHLADYLRYPTRGPVSVPLGGIMGAISRVCLVAKLSSKTQAWDQALETNPAIGREERDELWSVVPDIHEAAMDLMLVMLRRLGRGMLPLVPELLDHLARVFRSGMDVPAIRTAGYLVLEGLLTVAGPTLSKPAVAMVEPLAAACCRDLQQDAGLLLPRPSSSKPAAPAPGARANGAAAANADLFLPPGTCGPTCAACWTGRPS
ncbi:hypothetical protein CDD83_6494 [Cordyceps sp. RAO-2017]|nr:hypothetical protein CDD83_6494 [Cordyceps sp. RAO-2017]